MPRSSLNTSLRRVLLLALAAATLTASRAGTQGDSLEALPALPGTR